MHLTLPILLFPLITAFTGWLVIRLFLRFLFHPAEPRSVLGIRLQGILPAHQQKIANGIGAAAGRFFRDHVNLEATIGHPDQLKKLMPLVEEHIDDFLRNRLKTEMPMISLFIGDKTISSLKASFMKELESLFPKLMKQFAGQLSAQFNPEAVIREKLAAVPASALYTSLEKQMKKESGKAELFGLLTGLATGLLAALLVGLFA